MMVTDKKVLILSDGKPGHVNQSVAFSKHLGLDYDVCPVQFCRPLFKGLSYLFDRCHLKVSWLFDHEMIASSYIAVVSAGSNTYYANRVLAKKLGISSVAIMLPRGYRLDFDLIVAQEHDKPPDQNNIMVIPINLNYVEPQGYVTGVDGEKYAALIIGGDSSRGKLDPQNLVRQIEQIRENLPHHRFWLTTSRRTSGEVEEALQQFHFDWAVYYSKQQINPIADFLEFSDYVFITDDSTSMISEAVSYGTSKVEILLSDGNTVSGGKIGEMIRSLANESCLHIYDGQLSKASRKIDLHHVLCAGGSQRLSGLL